MCKSIAEGGQRCAGHTRENYLKGVPGTPNWWDAAIAYASTPEGAARVKADRKHFVDTGFYDLAGALKSALQMGESHRAANRETARLVRALTNVAVATHLAYR